MRKGNTPRLLGGGRKERAERRRVIALKPGAGGRVEQTEQLHTHSMLCPVDRWIQLGNETQAEASTNKEAPERTTFCRVSDWKQLLSQGRRAIDPSAAVACVKRERTDSSEKGEEEGKLSEQQHSHTHLQAPPVEQESTQGEEIPTAAKQ